MSASATAALPHCIDLSAPLKFSRHQFQFHYGHFIATNYIQHTIALCACVCIGFTSQNHKARRLSFDIFITCNSRAQYSQATHKVVTVDGDEIAREASRSNSIPNRQPTLQTIMESKLSTELSAELRCRRMKIYIYVEWSVCGLSL